ncbi:Piwi domain-containing protein [Xylaria palmicola]|nr:Piwi domain-containing protein [Xylaria palmicola]
MSGSQDQPSAPRHPGLERVSGMNLDGASDRPRGSVAGSHRGSVTGSHHGSITGSQVGSRPASRVGSPTRASAPGSRPPPPGPNTGLKPLRHVDLVGKRVDLPADAYLENSDKHQFTSRRGFNTQGKQIQIQLNIFPAEFKDNVIYQYDVSISPEPDKKPLTKKLWNSEPVQNVIRQVGGMWLFDGGKLAWSSKEIPRNEFRVTVDLDAGRPNRRGVSIYYIKVRQITTIQLNYIQQYLQGRIGWNNQVLECMNFFDHCMRQGPSENMTPIRRNVYPGNTRAMHLSSVVEARKGYYSAVRLGEAKRLMVNVDTANTAFWQTRTVAEIALRMFNVHKPEWSNYDFLEFAEQLRPVEQRDGQGRTIFARSDAFTLLKRLQKLKFVVHHRGKANAQKIYTVLRIVFDQRYEREGGHSKTVKFDKRMPDGTTQVTSVWQHYRDAYNCRLQYPLLPLIETTRDGFFPMELCNVADFQRYPFKLDPAETSTMITFAVTRPAQRKADIMEGLQKLNYANDPYLAEFGIRISGNMQVTNARLLKNPEVAFAGAKHNPGVSGRWDLRGKRFLEPNQKQIKSWGLVVCGNACTKQDAEAFASKFTQTYRNHGGNIGVPLHVIQVPFSVGHYGQICQQAWNMIGSKFKNFPQMIFFVVPNKNNLNYDRIKKSMDCRFCTPSQVLQGGHVKKANAQYMSNVAMKVNAKLGGVTCKVASPTPTSPFFQCPTMMIGLDISHAAPASDTASVAAMTVSMDKNATRFAAACETNGWREEALRPDICQAIFPRLLRHWISIHKTAPQHVYFFRDGVAEGQFRSVMDTEVNGIRQAFRESNAGNPKMTVIIATKRHHIRFFPKPNDQSTGDRNANPLPGTLVERDATHPHHFDFYLCSHVAIQGTARPVHYQVIHDDANVAPDQLQAMIYQQCYQYARSTTPVSLHPAVYYAHVAAARARSHENIHSSQLENAGGKEGQPTAKHPSEIYGPEYKQLCDAPKLVPMNHQGVSSECIQFMNTTMWYM